MEEKRGLDEVLRETRRLIAKGYCHTMAMRPEVQSAAFANWFEDLFGGSLKSPRLVICPWDHPDAAVFSLADALQKACDGNVEMFWTAEAAVDAGRPGGFAIFNAETGKDGQGHVLRWLDKAIIRSSRLRGDAA